MFDFLRPAWLFVIIDIRFILLTIYECFNEFLRCFFVALDSIFIDFLSFVIVCFFFPVGRIFFNIYKLFLWCIFGYLLLLMFFLNL